MPTYAYACTACGHRFEVQQSFSDAALTDCPECEGRLRKLFNSVGIVFKGSGFYRTDSRASSNGAKDGAGAGSPAEKAGPAEKPAASEKSASSDKPAASGSSSSGSSSSGSKAPAA